MFCPSCQSKIDNGYAFCPVCGNRMGNRVCSKCGNLLEERDDFCGKCGTNTVSNSNTVRGNSLVVKEGVNIKKISIFATIIILLGVSTILWFNRTVPHNDQPVAQVRDSSVSNNVSSSTQENSPDNTVDQQIKGLMENYLDNIVRAINEQNFSIVEGCLLPGSSIYSSQQDLVKRLGKQGITEKLNNSEIMQISEGYSPGEYKVRVCEDYKIYYSDGSIKNKSFVWLYTVVSNGGKFYLTNIEKTN